MPPLDQSCPSSLLTDGPSVHVPPILPQAGRATFLPLSSPPSDFDSYLQRRVFPDLSQYVESESQPGEDNTAGYFFIKRGASGAAFV